MITHTKYITNNNDCFICLIAIDSLLKVINNIIFMMVVIYTVFVEVAVAIYLFCDLLLLNRQFNFHKCILPDIHHWLRWHCSLLLLMWF